MAHELTIAQIDELTRRYEELAILGANYDETMREANKLSALIHRHLVQMKLQMEMLGVRPVEVPDGVEAEAPEAGRYR